MSGTNINLPGVSLSASALTVATMQVTGLTAGFVVTDGAGNMSTTALTAEVPSTRLINTTAPLTGGGDLSADRTLAITFATPVALSADAPAAGSAASVAHSDHDHGVQGLVRCVEFAVAHAATVDSATALTTNAHIYKVRFKIGTQYSANATLDVGQAGHTTDFVNHAAAGADPALADLSLLAVGDIIDIDGITTVAVAGAVRASIGGAPSVGAGTLMVQYAEPQA